MNAIELEQLQFNVPTDLPQKPATLGVSSGGDYKISYHPWIRMYRVIHKRGDTVTTIGIPDTAVKQVRFKDEWPQPPAKVTTAKK